MENLAQILQLAQIIPPEFIKDGGLVGLAGFVYYQYLKETRKTEQYEKDRAAIFERVVIALHTASTSVVETGKTLAQSIENDRQMIELMRERDSKVDDVLDMIKRVAGKVAA